MLPRLPPSSWRLVVLIAATAVLSVTLLLRPDVVLANLYRALTVGTAPRRQLFVPAFVSHIDVLDLLPSPPAPTSSCATAHQQPAHTPAPALHSPSAGQVVQSLVMQMSRERREKGRDCSLPYFAADSIIPAYIDSRLTFCDHPDPKVAQVNGASSLGPSRISCLPLYTLAQLDDPTLCEANAVALQLPLLINDEAQSPWLHLQRGALTGSCTQRSMPPKVLTHCLHDWFNQAFIASSNVTCDQWIEDDTYIVTRHDSLNAWYTLSDMWFAFLSAAVFKLQPHSSRAIFADAQPSGVASSYWSAAFSAAAPLPLLQLAKQKMSEGVRTLCFRRAIFNPSATTSVIERGLQHVQSSIACSDNVLLQAFATQVRLLMTSEDPPSPDRITVSVLILKDDSLPPSSNDVFALLQRRLSSSASVVVANVRRTSFKQIVTSVAHASLLLATSDAAAAYAVYLRAHSACVSLQFDEAPLLRMRLVTSWARIAHSSVSVAAGEEEVLRVVGQALADLRNTNT